MEKSSSEEKRSSSRSLARLYSADYFRGLSSGYSTEGYENDHPDWALWMDLISTLVPRGSLADLGCAYGYLVEEARRRGFHAVGVDVSPFALRQLNLPGGGLSRGRLEELPLPSNSFDVVALFDVLEHLEQPEKGLDEAVRILRSGGLLIGATPDPVFFQRPEPTHWSERPPSFWVVEMERRSLAVSYRFSDEPYNFQFLATPSAGRLRESIRNFQFDYFGPEEDFAAGDEALEVALRFGWEELEQGSRSLKDKTAALYILNRKARCPRSASLRFCLRSSGRFSTLRVRINGYVLKDVHLTSEEPIQEVEVGPFLVPPGGHHLFFELSPGGVDVTLSDLRVRSEPVPLEALLESLPFDLYQRYQVAADLVEIVHPESILDVGGYIGDADGHLASPDDFFGGRSRVKVTDVRSCDHPRHLTANAAAQPFEKEQFEMVVSLDVLEHIAPAARRDYLCELDRLAEKFIVIGAPFRTDAVIAAEESLLQDLMGDHVFLKEHREMGLPGREEILSYFGEENGHRIFEVRNGYLPTWKLGQSWTQLLLSTADYKIITEFHRHYNRTMRDFDRREPAYRSIFLICKDPLPASLQGTLEDFARPEHHSEPIPTEFLEGESWARIASTTRGRIESLRSALRDVQFLANSRMELVELLRAERNELVRQLKETPLRELAIQRFKERRRKET